MSDRKVYDASIGEERMKLRLIVLWGVIAVLLVQPGCKEAEKITGPGDFVTRKITGQVVRKTDGALLDNAIVRNVIGAGGSDTTKNGGNFLFSYSINSGLDVKLIATYPGLKNDTATFRLGTVADTSIIMRLDTTSSSTIISPTSGKPSSIFVSSVEATNVAIRGSGLKESALIVFEVRDSVGNPLVGLNRPTVKFKLLGGPNGGEFLYPTQVQSDPTTGKVATVLTSGTKAGIVRIGASTSNDSVKSGNITLTISGGLPHSGHFSLSRDRANIAGGIFDNLKARFTVVLGDRFGNPSPPTQVYFSTTGGIITASATTDANGVASAELTSTNPRPAVAIIRATTIGDTVGNLADSIITQTVPIVFSRATQILLPSAGFTVPDSGSLQFNYQVQDANGNPLVAGTTIKLSLTGSGASDLELQGTTDYTMPDVDDTSYTNFRAVIVDHTRGGIGGVFSVVVEVKSQNGDLTQSVAGNAIGGAGGGGGGGGSGLGSPKYVNFVGASTTSLSVYEGGDVTNSSSTISFAVTDSAGGRLGPNAFAPNGSVQVVFYAVHYSGGVAGTFTRTLDSTDNLGQVYARFTAGNRSGIVRVFAAVASNTAIKGFVDIIISGGFPDSNHTAIQMDRLNIPPSGSGTISMQMADQFGNPPKASNVYFTTDGGSIQPKGLTNEAGQLSVVLIEGPPVPSNPTAGRGFITASLFGKDSVRFQKKISYLFSGSPIITPTNIPANDTITVFDGGFTEVNFSVLDANGNPLAAGNSLSISVTGSVASQIVASGDIGITTIDSRNPADANFKVRFTDNAPGVGSSGDFAIIMSVSGPNGTANRRFYGHLNGASTINPPSPSAKNPAQIAFLGVSNTDISVAGTGANENTVLTYEVRDSLGTPVDRDHRATAHFTLQFFPNTFVLSGTAPRLIPTIDSTDEQGKLRVSAISGTTAGVVQVVVTINLPGGRQLQTSPVRITIHAGFPDQRHFTIATPKGNFGGLDLAYVNQDFTVQVADKYSNPVQAGTSVYFHSAHGTMTTGNTSGTTDINGFVTQKLYSANPFPVGIDSLSLGQGWSRVYAQTQGDSAVQITDSVTILWSGKPIITRTDGGATSYALANGGSVGPLTFTVKDRLGHPMVAGTTITVSGNGLSIDGNVPATLFDTQFGGSGITDFTFNIADADATTIAPQPTKFTLTVTVTHPVYGTFTKVFASGTVL